MPEELPQVAVKAKRAMALIRTLQLAAAQEHPEFWEEPLAELRQLYPEVRFLMELRGFRVFVMSGELPRLPKAIRYAADYIEEVNPRDGTAIVRKDRLGTNQGRKLERSLCNQFPEVCPQPLPKRTAWEVVLEDERF